MNSAIEFTIADFPGYAEFVARENLIRGASCLGLNEKICGLEVLPINAAHVRLLALVRSPFMAAYPVKMLCDKPDILGDIMRFLWIVSPQYEQGARTRAHWWQRRTARDKFNAAFAPIMAMRLDKVIQEIMDYVEEAYIDSEDGDSGKSYCAFEVSIAHELHKHYGYRVDFWNHPPKNQNPLLVPLKLVFQFRKLRAKTEGIEIANRSDKLVELGLKSIGEREQKIRNYERELATTPAQATDPKLPLYELN